MDKRRVDPVKVRKTTSREKGKEGREGRRRGGQYRTAVEH